MEKSNKIAIRCTTEKEWEALKRKIQTSDGIMTKSWDQMIRIMLGKQSLIMFLNKDKTENGWNNDNGWAEREGYTIISTEEFLKPKKAVTNHKAKHKGTLGVNFNNIVNKLSPKQTLKHKEKEDTVSETNWKPIASAPRNTYILLRGDSGMLTYPKFYIVGKLELDYRDDWININNDRLTDYGYVPEEWMEIPL